MQMQMLNNAKAKGFWFKAFRGKRFIQCATAKRGKCFETWYSFIFDLMVTKSSCGHSPKLNGQYQTQKLFSSVSLAPAEAIKQT